MKRLMEHRIPADAYPERLDQYLSHVIPETSRSQIQRLLKDGHILLNGQAPKAARHVAPGNRLRIEIPEPAAMDLKAEAIPLRILYEDKWFLIVDKPVGLVVHPAVGHFSGTLVNALLAHGAKLSSVAGAFKPGIVHRLDKDTSGLMVVAKDDQTHRHLSQQFAARQVSRVYLAIVQGVVRQSEGTIEAPIGRHPIHRQRMSVRSDAGREAITRYRVLKRFARASYIELLPQTGRTHQLRVHLAHIGHPILGDLRYGAAAGFPRQALHAHRLGFIHPAKGKAVEFTSPFPRDLQGALKKLAS